jgi:hypothetical protein
MKACAMYEIKICKFPVTDLTEPMRQVVPCLSVQFGQCFRGLFPRACNLYVCQKMAHYVKYLLVFMKQFFL